jgi:hypothetical protein
LGVFLPKKTFLGNELLKEEENGVKCGDGLVETKPQNSTTLGFHESN